MVTRTKYPALLKELVRDRSQSFLGALGLLEAARGVIHGAVEEIIDPAEHVVLREHCHLETGPGLAAEKVPEIVFRQDNGQSNSLRSTP